MLVVFAACLAAGCEPAAENRQVENESGNAVVPPFVVPAAEQPTDRAGLLTAIARAASLAALGQEDTARQRSLDGKRFEFRIRFGCATGTNKQSVREGFDVRFNEKDRALRLRATPDLTLDDPAIASLAGENAEAVEGFWVYRPWLLSAGCPIAASPQSSEITGDQKESRTRMTAPAKAESAAPRRHRVGLAQFFTDTDSRTARRDHRAYEATVVLNDDESPSVSGYNLVLSGRLRGLPNGKVISCAVSTPDQPPECVVSVEFDRVRVEVPETGDVIAEWGS